MLITKSCGLVSAILLPSFCVPFVNVDFPFFSWKKKILLSLGCVGVTVLSPALLHISCLSPCQSFEIAVS